MREHAPPSSFSTLPRRMITKPDAAYQLSADVHLSPGRFLDQDGYPVDYGLPKMAAPQAPMSLPIVPPPPPHASYYRTLPYNRGHKKNYPREAEFVPAPAYEAYADTPTDVRYSLEGYPASAPPVFAPNEPFPEPINNFIPSPPAAYKSDAPEVSSQQNSESSIAAISSPAASSSKAWPAGFSQSSSSSTKTSESQQNLIESAINAMVTSQPSESRTQQESPDEGYGEDGTEI
jgi:hypothetical protein